MRAAAELVEAHRRLQSLQQERQPLLPRSLRELQRQAQGREEGSQQEQARWQQLQQLSASVAEAQQQLRLALAAHEQCCSLMQGRLWWRDAHLLPQPAATVAAALEAGAANPAALVALAAVHAFLHPLWQRSVVADWRAGGCTGGLPRLLQNLTTGHTAAALQQEGHGSEAKALRAAAKLCRGASALAAQAASKGRDSVAALASVARQRADFWRAARKPWKVGGRRVWGPPMCLPRLCKH